ncbi:hypothetical protein [Arthrobacter sp. KBS0703]|uniref:hypothetical protein n=1 Tax=Arthrobacter sp. KBS0703 TaxID=1955698 RepID=UPI0021B11A4D|nr:hypothetical protein [Arthrobacter sp. KBS0703]
MGVQLEGGHAKLERVAERGQGFFGPFAAAAAVGLQVKVAAALVCLDAGRCFPGSVRRRCAGFRGRGGEMCIRDSCLLYTSRCV